MRWHKPLCILFVGAVAACGGNTIAASGAATSGGTGGTGGTGGAGSGNAGNPSPIASPASDTPYVIEFVSNGQVLEVAGASTADGAHVVQNNLTETGDRAAQQWTLRSVASGYTVVNGATGKCLDVYQHNMQQWTCNGGSTETWLLVSQGNATFYLQNVGDQAYASAVGNTASTQTMTAPAGTTSTLQFFMPNAGGTSGGTTGGTTGGSSGASNANYLGLSNAVVYQVYTPIFSAAGNFAAVTGRLQTLHNLGVNVIYLMPITPVNGPVSGHGFFGPLGSPYAVADFTTLNPNFGTASDFNTLLSTAHGLGMKVIIDEVLNQTGWSNPLLAAHPEYYAHDSGGNVEPGAYWSSSPYPDVAQLDWYGAGASSLQTYMTNMLVTWLQTYPIDGFRFDTASYYMDPTAHRPNIPVAYWQSLATSLRAVNPNVLLLGEELTPDLALAPFSLDYGWTFYQALQTAFSNGSGAANVQAQYQSQQPPAYPAGMTHLNIVQNWDKEADYQAFGGFPQARAAAVVNTLLPGVPMLFNGEEVGNTNFGSGTGDNTMMTIDWAGTNAQAMTAFFTSVLGLRANNSTLQTGTLTWLSNSNGDPVVSFERSDTNATYVVIVNLSATSASGSLSNGPSATAWTDVSPVGSPGGTAHGSPSSYHLLSYDFAVFVAN